MHSCLYFNKLVIISVGKWVGHSAEQADRPKINTIDYNQLLTDLPTDGGLPPVEDVLCEG